MPKRKRESYENEGDRVSQMRKQDVYEKYTQSKRLLHRALKTAKGFERQKLGKRLKLASSSGQTADIARINREIEALKGLELAKATDAHLHRSLLKIKVFAESDLLPDEVRRVLPKPEGTEEMVTALHNVTSGMCNTKQVKDVMERSLSGMYIAMGIPAPVGKVKGAKKEPIKGILKGGSLKKAIKVEISDEEIKEGSAEGVDEPAWEGFESTDGQDDGAEGEDEDENAEGGAEMYESLDEEDLSRYEALLGGSSDEESFDEEEYAIHQPSKPITRQSLSPSPSPSGSPTPSESESTSVSESELPPPPAKSSKQSKPKQPPPQRPSGSTFLPSLMGGYWSGSESASEIEDTEPTPPIRKNRPGQMARRAIWEKKYGNGANHIKTGQGSVAEKRERDDGWDAKRGAKDDGGRGRRVGGRGRGDSGRQRNFSQVTGENAITIEPRRRGLGRKDDVGVLHPSWQAAKKAKDMKKTAKFEGKKVTFD
jgi:hypothetical protein